MAGLVPGHGPTVATLGGFAMTELIQGGLPVTLYFPITLTDTDTPADLVTDFVLPFSGSVESFQYVTEVVATSGGTADADIELQLGSTTITGSAMEGLTQADFDTVGKIKAGSTITAANTFSKSDTLSVVCTESTTNFTAGVVGLHIYCVATGL